MRLLIFALFGLSMVLGESEQSLAMPYNIPQVTTMAASSDGQYIAVATERGWLALWDLSAGRPVRIIKAHEDDILMMRFVSNGKQLLTGSEDRSAKLWSVPDLSNVHTVWTSGAISGGDLTAGGESLFLGLWDGSLEKWDLNSGNRVASIQAHLFGRVTLDISPSGESLVTGGSDQTIRKWETRTFRQLRYFKDGKHGNKAHLGTIYGIYFLDEDRVLSSASRKSFVLTHMTLWDAHTGQPRGSAQDAAGIRGGVSLAADNSRVVFAEFSEDHAAVSVINLENWQTISVFHSPERIRDVVITPNGKLVMAGTISGRVRFWGADDGRYLGSALTVFNQDWSIETSDGQVTATNERAYTLKNMLKPYLQTAPQ